MRKQRTLAALGQQKADLVLKNGNVVNVFSGEVITADVAVLDGVIVGVGSYDGKEEIDVSGKYVCPGLIDAHLHLESSMINPAELISRAAAKGTTTFIADPHEAANVSGALGIDHMMQQTEGVSADVFFMMPSCVPATPFEDNGNDFTAQDMKQFLHNDRVLGLGEVMDFPAVLSNREDMIEKIELFQDKIIDGHSGFLRGKELTAYKLAGIHTDHECTDIEGALETVRNGMYVLIREGSAARNVEAIVRGIVERKISSDRFCFCTDDKHVEDIEKEGHINFNIKKAVECGMNAVQAIRCATIYPATCYGLKTKGAVAPGYQADLVVFDNLSDFTVSSVFYKGEPVRFVKSGKPCDERLLDTVHLKQISEKQLELRVGDGEHPVIELASGQITTTKRMEILPQLDGVFIPQNGYNKAVVIERHKSTGTLGVAAVKGFGLKNGAIASSVAHDSHNIVTIGDNDRDILLAVEALKEAGGGFSLVEDGQVVTVLPLPVMGLMSERESEKVQSTLHEMIRKAHEMGVAEGMDPFVTLSFLALPVIPELRLTNRGLFDVLNSTFIK